MARIRGLGHLTIEPLHLQTIATSKVKTPLYDYYTTQGRFLQRAAPIIFASCCSSRSELRRRQQEAFQGIMSPIGGTLSRQERGVAESALVASIMPVGKDHPCVKCYRTSGGCCKVLPLGGPSGAQKTSISQEGAGGGIISISR
jgi:hypothetical protein